MLKVPDPGRGFVRRLGFAAAAIFVLSAASSHPAEALSPVNPGAAPAANSVSDELITEVRGGGHHGGGGGWGGGGRSSGGGRAVFHSSGFRSGPVFRGSGFRSGHVFRGGYRHSGFAFRHHRHFFHHRRFYGGSYYYPWRRCHLVWTYYGPRRVCHWRHHWRHHHRWHHRRYW
ncbi:MAG TPA: hypothetical protein VGO54_02065 [Bradyrhizobium sp.]|nr:hypothetical protein [Bradyrhizobium sp.]